MYVVMKISGYEGKTGRSGQVGSVQHVHMYDKKCIEESRGGFIPHCNALPSLDYTKEGSLVKGLPILC